MKELIQRGEREKGGIEGERVRREETGERDDRREGGREEERGVCWKIGLVGGVGGHKIEEKREIAVLLRKTNGRYSSNPKVPQLLSNTVLRR